MDSNRFLRYGNTFNLSRSHNKTIIDNSFGYSPDITNNCDNNQSKESRYNCHNNSSNYDDFSWTHDDNNVKQYFN